MSAITVQHLSKRFRTLRRRAGRFGVLASLIRPDHEEIVAVDDISFTIEAGEIIGYLGPNGAGKSTTIKMLTGVLVPTTGEILVHGLTPHKSRKEHSRQIGVVFGQRSQLLYDLPPRDAYELLRHMYRIPSSVFADRLARFSAWLEAERLLERPVRTLSLGQRMRCEIIAALLHGPRVLFLDEPTIGLDVVAKDRIRQFVAELNRTEGVTVVLTTHDLADIEQLCPRVVLIDRGRILFDGELAQVRRALSRERKLNALFADEATARRLVDRLANRPGLTARREGRAVIVTFDHSRLSTAAVFAWVNEHGEPSDLTVQDESIEAIIRRVYEQGLPPEETVNPQAGAD